MANIAHLPYRLRVDLRHIFQLTRPADRDCADLVLLTARARSGLGDYTIEEELNADC